MASLMSILQQAGFRGEGLKMAYAIAMAESGGRANAHNSVGNSAGTDRGLFQINSYYHSEVSDSQAYNALANAKAAYRISHGGTNWSAWSTYHNGAYKQFYGGSSANVSGGGGGGSTFSGAGTVTPKLDKDELASQYGLSAALINSSKELKSLFNKAVSGGWSAAKFGAQLKNSKWWRTQSSTLRKYLTTKFTDPATFKQNWGNGQYKVNSLAVAVGLGNQINSKGQSSKLLKAAIYNSLALGWSDARIKDWLGSKASTHGGVMWGEAGEAFDKFHELAYLNGMRYSSDWYKKNAVSVVSGKSTLENVEAGIRKAAAARYGAFAEQINAGQNVMDLAAPYIKSAATLLELPETDMDLFNNHIAKAMTARVAKGAESGSQMPLWEFENEVRADPLWRKTNNARESMMTVARQVARDFGLAY